MADEKKWEDIGSIPLEIDYSWNPDEKRGSDRIDIKFLKRLSFEGILQIEAEITYDKIYVMKGIIKDLSLGGLNIYLSENYLPFKDEAKFPIKFKIGSRSFDIFAILKWCKQEDTGHCIGLEFVDLTPQEEIFLKSLYQSLTYK